jgi:hypothetical protein
MNPRQDNSAPVGALLGMSHPPPVKSEVFVLFQMMAFSDIILFLPGLGK